jgi:phosphofructokinase-like protein
MSKRLRVGVLTGGGDCPGLNAVIRAVTKSLTLEHGADVLGFEDGFEGMIERRMQPLGYRDVSGILTRGGTILGSSNRGNPFSYFRRDGADVSDDVVRYCKDLELTAVVAIGGDGTMSIAHGLQEKGVPFVGVPKTIDNDLVGTDRTFGFNSAVTIVTEAIDRLHTTAQSHERIMIVETMGRYAGWIALYAGVAGGADVILIPEIEYDVEEIARVCRAREGGGQQFTIVVVAEGAKPVGGERAIQEIIESSPDPIRLGGISRVLQEQLESHVDSEIRATILGHTQRGGTPTPFDRILGTAFGSYAAAMVTDGQFGRMVALQDNRLTSVPLSEVANKTRTIPLDAPILHAARAVGTSFGVRDLDVRMQGSRPSASVS